MLNNLFLLVLAGLCLASVASWRHLIAAVQEGRPILTSRKRRPIPLGLVDVGIMFLTWVVGQLVAVGLVQISGASLAETMTGNRLAILIGLTAICQLGSTALGVGIIYSRYRRSPDVLGLKPLDWFSDVRLGGLAFLTIIPPLLMLQWSLTFLVDYRHSTLEAMKEHTTIFTLVSAWLAAVVVAPITEEVFFRGVLQSWLERLSRMRTSFDTLIAGGWDAEEAPEGAEVNGTEPRKAVLPILLSSAIFAGVHLGQGLAPVPLFFLGLALGYMYFKTHSLWPCIVLHAGLNGFSIFWYTLGLLVNGRPE